MKNYFLLIKLHRWLGFIIAPLVILICITGILLNHTSELALGKKGMPPSIAHWLYGIQVIDEPKIMINNLAIQQRSNGLLMVSNQPIGQCEYGLLGAVRIQQQIIIACAYKLVFISADGDFLEEHGQSLGIPMPLTAINSIENTVLITSHDTAWNLNPDTLLATQANQKQIEKLYTLHAVKNNKTPKQKFGVYEISLERLILDLHSGRALGWWGTWLMDAIALIMISMIVTGYIAWKTKKTNHNRR